MNHNLSEIIGPALVRKLNLRVLVCKFLNNQLTGNCLQYYLGKLEKLLHYEEGKEVDYPITYEENLKLPDYKGADGKDRSLVNYNGYAYNG